MCGSTHHNGSEGRHVTLMYDFPLLPSSCPDRLPSMSYPRIYIGRDPLHKRAHPSRKYQEHGAACAMFLACLYDCSECHFLFIQLFCGQFWKVAHQMCDTGYLLDYACSAHRDEEPTLQRDGRWNRI